MLLPAMSTTLFRHKPQAAATIVHAVPVYPHRPEAKDAGASAIPMAACCQVSAEALPCQHCRSCRDRMAAHKIRQREHSHRRVAQAAAAMQRRAAAETKAAPKAQPLPAAAPSANLPGASCGQTVTGTVFQEQQEQRQQLQQPSGGTQPLAPQPWAPWQQPPLWQQDKDTMDSLAAQHNALHTSMMAQQQQQQQQQPTAGGLTEAPSIFADMPVDQLPVAMHVDCQVTSNKHALPCPLFHVHSVQQVPEGMAPD
jgi:hypothetical protein